MISAGSPAGDVAVDAYDRVRTDFSWNIPEHYNIGLEVTDKWAARDPDRVAVIECDDDRVVRTTFRKLAEQSNQLANWLTAQGLRRQDRVAVLAPQRVETAIAHAAIFKAGGISVPLFSLFGLDALRHRIGDSGARFLIADAAGKAKIGSIAGELPELEYILCMDDLGDSAPSWKELPKQSTNFSPIITRADDPAIIIYTSGTTGPPKGALHAHRVLLGHLPGVEMSHDGFPKPGDCMWTPADWAWIGGLFDVLLPSLHHGVPVVAKRFDKFDATAVFRLMKTHGVRNVFMPPTALKFLRSQPVPRDQRNVSLRSIASGGEALGKELLSWALEEVGVNINEFYGQTECNMIVSSCSSWFSGKPGAMGKPVPGHNVAIIDDDGSLLPPDEEGNIAVRSPDPVMFLGYWNNPKATEEKFIGDWLVTGDRGIRDEEGFLHFFGRADDVITSAGYRIGPGEIEDCLIRHPAVASAGVVGVPDAMRTEIVTAFVSLRPGYDGNESLVADLQEHVRFRLGAHQYPRTVHFLTELPVTVTGKIMRQELRKLAGEHAADSHLPQHSG
jgi:acetyl-CoA synthetase